MVVTVITSLEDFNEIVGEFLALRVRGPPTDEHEKIRQHTPVVIEFCARWCGPSQRINPKFDKCSERLHYDGLGFYRVDIDSQPDIMQVADVKKIPLFAVFKGGKKLGVVEGADNRALATLLENHS